MKILAVSPLELPFTTGARYTGLERLAVSFATEWAKLGHQVAILAHKDTNVGHGVTLLPCEGYPDNDRTIHAEQRALQRWQAELYQYDIVWDISNLHLPARFMPQLKTCNVFHANPQYAFMSGYVKAPRNLVSWSKWGVREIARYYRDGQPTQNGGQKSVYQETILIDDNVYKPSGKSRGKRFLTLGRMSEEKGNLNVAILCKELGLQLDIAGGRGSEHVPGEDHTQYEKDILKHCDGKNIVFHGEVSEEEKLELMQSCRALIYMTDHVEITSHKIQEAMLCGAPVIVPNHGGFPEIVTHGGNGWLCSREQDFVDSIGAIDDLTPPKYRDSVAAKYHPETVARGYIDLFRRIIDGERW
jgi:glycosyltransferase involved in cell wall biosynthesis